MNKVIFQIGLLAFCVAAVVFGSQHIDLLETISRSFIVFVGVILIVALSLATSSLFSGRTPTAQPEKVKENKAPGAYTANGKKSVPPTIPTKG
jgi:hypothetical protein